MATVSSPTATKTGLSPGQTYQFRVKAINKYGSAYPSLTLVVLATQTPATPAAPLMTLDATTISVTFSLPNSYNTPITLMSIQFQTSIPGEFLELVSYCNGSDSSILTKLKCSLPMSSLRLEPFNLMANTTVYARIMAANVRGWSQPSPLNAVGPIIQGPPVMMSPPVRGASTSNKQVEVNWETVNFPMNGGSSITSYVVYWDQGTNAWVELIGETSKYTLTSYTIYTNVIAGLTY
jgi:hypothetical protein